MQRRLFAPNDQGDLGESALARVWRCGTRSLCDAELVSMQLGPAGCPAAHATGWPGREACRWLHLMKPSRIQRRPGAPREGRRILPGTKTSIPGVQAGQEGAPPRC